MPTYAFKGRNRLNELVSGEREAASQDELRALLRREQVVLTTAEEKGREISIPKLGTRKKVKAKELAVFTRQFSVMIDAGLPLVQCLDILAEQQLNAFFKDVLRQVRQNVEEGTTLFAALEKFPKVFDPLYTHMVEAGETGGVLDLILQRLATLIEKVVKLKRSVVSASIYPAAVVIVAVLAITVIMIVVIPQFQQIFLGLLAGRAASAADPDRYGNQRFSRGMGRPRPASVSSEYPLVRHTITRPRKDAGISTSFY